MSIAKFIKTALGAILRRDELTASCEAAAKTIREGVLPEYEQAAQFFANVAPKSSEIRLYESDFRRKVGKAKLFETVSEAFTNSLMQLELISEQAATIFAEEEPTGGLSFKKATYVRLVTGISFASDYSLKLLNWLYANEESATSEIHAEDQFTKQEREYVEAYFDAFCGAIKAMLRSVKDLQKLVDAMPDVPVSDGAEQAATANLGASKIDPLMLNGLVTPVKVSVKWNPFYLIGTVIADWQAKSYKATEEELKLLQMRRANLERLRKGQPDAAQEREIEHLAERIRVLTYELQTAKEKYRV